MCLGRWPRSTRVTLRAVMQRDLDKMRRRPFFFPLVLPVLFFIALVAAAAWLFDARATTVVFVVVMPRSRRPPMRIRT